MGQGLVELLFGIRHEIEANTAGRCETLLDQVAPEAAAAMGRLDDNQRQVRLDLPIALQIGESDKIATVDRDHRCHPRGREHPMRSFEIFRKRQPTLGRAKADDTFEVRSFVTDNGRHAPILPPGSEPLGRAGNGYPTRPST